MPKRVMAAESPASSAPESNLESETQGDLVTFIVEWADGDDAHGEPPAGGTVHLYKTAAIFRKGACQKSAFEILLWFSGRLASKPEVKTMGRLFPMKFCPIWNCECKRLLMLFHG